MRYRLRTLLIVLALGPPVLAGAWIVVKLALRRDPRPSNLRALSIEAMKRQNGEPAGSN